MSSPMNEYGNGDFTNDAPELVGTGAIKYDGGKPSVYRGLIDYFPRAGMAVAEVSTFGANKYAWNGWSGVEDGVNRYSDAMMRHLLQEAAGEEFDKDSNLRHAAHIAWGAMARLELMLREEEAMEDWMASEEVSDIVDYIKDNYYLNPEQTEEDVYDLEPGQIISFDSDEEIYAWLNKLMGAQNNA